MKLNELQDLTRWNRAGLNEFRYINGNTVTYLETIRQQLLIEFDKSGAPQWKELVELFPELANESSYQIRKRLLSQYYGDRRDYAWEILRTFTRSAHILGEYINAYANEAYLPTAVEWDNLRKLVAMLGYRPSPPASAETYIALMYKENESGEVDKGFAIKNKPEAGESTVIFESQEKIEGSDKRNILQLKDWNKNKRQLFKFSSQTTVRYYLDEKNEDINVGDFGVVVSHTQALPVEVASLNFDDNESYVGLSLLADIDVNDFPLYATTLYLQPSFVSSPLPHGEGTAVFYKDVSFSDDEIVFGKKGSDWNAMQVLKNQHRHVEFNDGGQAIETNEYFYRSRVLKKQRHDVLAGGSEVYVLPEEFSSNSEYFVDADLNPLSATITEQVIDTVSMKYIDISHDDDIYYPDDMPAGRVKTVEGSKIRFAGKASDIETGQWALVQTSTAIEAYQISSISVHEDWFTLNLDGLTHSITLLRSAFKLSLKHKGHDFNNNLAWSGDSTDSATLLDLQDETLVEHLTLGQMMICANEDNAFVVELKDISTTAEGDARLHLSPAFHLQEGAHSFRLHNTKIYGNTVRATHGETQPEKIVGNGDASKAGQCFQLTSDSISWVADADFSSGVRADLSLQVGQRTWLQVEDLSTSLAEDHHYEVQIDQDGLLSICFGDGKFGRRLPSGVDNVRVTFRNGYGEDGNLEPNTLVKMVKPHRLIEDFVAPLAASGGAEKEASESMRDSAPATVLALSRAVSLDDFTHLAAHHSMVWQAQAFEKMPDRPARSLIEVVVVAAGGATFVAGSDTASLIQDYLVNHAAPGTPVSVISYSPLLMQLKLSIMVDEVAYDSQQVELAVIEHLKTSLTIKQRKLGQPLYRSDIIALLEQVDGVENGHCEILDSPYAVVAVDRKPRLQSGDDGKIRKISILPDQLLYLDVEAYPLQISTLDYEI